MVLLFSITLFTSSFLLFCVQPMVGKLLLPYLGGAPVVWNICMVFFQLMLLGGYAYANILSFGKGQRYQIIHLAVLALPLFVLPIGLSPTAIQLLSGGADPVPWLLRVLFFGAGLPFFVIATSNPLLQSWFSKAGHAQSKDPYFLNIASNTGSLLGLLSYPFLLEPLLSLAEQRNYWAKGYGIFAFLVLLCFISVWGRATPNEETSSGESILKAFRGIKSSWFLLSLLPSSLLLGVTTYITTEIGGFPLLWVVPLSLYLFSFILVFSSQGEKITHWASRWLGLLVVALLLTILLDASEPPWIVIPLHLCTFFVATLVCHGRLAEERPPAAKLTSYYFAMALGGVMGGAINALLSPVIFSSVIEYPLVLLLTCLYRFPFATKQTHWGKYEKFWPAGVILLLGVGMVLTKNVSIPSERLRGVLVFGLPALLCYRNVSRPKAFFLGLCLLFIGGRWLYTDPKGKVLLATRNYFGVLRIFKHPSGRFFQLVHGNTVHGRQRVEGPERLDPIGYYRSNGPVDELMRSLPENNSLNRIAIIGLGAGTLYCHSKKGQRWDYYEIDPAVEKFALQTPYFSFLKECAKTPPRIIKGDARLQILTAEPKSYLAILIDAFSSDAIPQHLLTKEALEVYLERLADGGVLIFHISNRYLNLAPVLGNLARELNLVAKYKTDDLKNASHAEDNFPSSWAVLARSGKNIEAATNSPDWLPLPTSNAKVWTDDYSSLFSALNY